MPVGARCCSVLIRNWRYANINALRAAHADHAALSLVQARKLVARLMTEDVGSALRMAGRNTRPSDDADQAAFF